MTENVSYDYENLVGKLESGEAMPITESEIALVIEEARRRRDAEVLVGVAEWYEDVKEDAQQYLAFAAEAAALGSPKANFCLGQEYKTGDRVSRDYEKAYEHFQKGADYEWGWAPINPEDSGEFMSNDGEVTAGELEAKGDWDWWMFVLRKHPTRALKCGMADWYMEKGEVETALGLCSESGEEGFPYAARLMLEYYLPGQLRVPIWGKWSKDGVEDMEKARYWYRKAEHAGEDVKEYAGQLGIVSEYVQQLIARAKGGGNAEETAELALAYLNGDGCPKDLDSAFSYAEDLLFKDDDYGVFLELQEAAVKNSEVKRRYNLLMQKSYDVEKL